ncbi:MAG TPA: hypothetical protein VHZ03_31920 [Trebonia sp.]|nr:hypothetical protein [Trebonia sp.]
MARLLPGFTVNLLDDLLTGASILISSGVRPFRGTGHAPDCVVARDDWRRLDEEEAATLLGEGPRPPAESLSLLDLGEGLLADAHRALLPFLAGDGTRPGAVLAGASLADALRAFQSAVTQVLFDRYGLVAETTGAADMIVHQSDQASTAFNPAAGEFVGLHIDTHQRLPFGERAGAMTLCSVNVGFADRYLDFVNLPVSSLVRLLAERGVPAPRSSAELKEAFFARFADYPVLRLVLRPGQAYLCVTQNTIHDGATNHAGMPDVSFLTLHRLAHAAPHAARLAAAELAGAGPAGAGLAGAGLAGAGSAGAGLAGAGSAGEKL